jgi:hypothetical protein
MASHLMQFTFGSFSSSLALKGSLNRQTKYFSLVRRLKERAYLTNVSYKL